MNNYRSDRVLKIGKNKEGTKATLMLEFDGLHQSMRERDDDKSRELAGQLSSLGRAAKQKNRSAAQMQFSELTREDPDMPF